MSEYDVSWVEWTKDGRVRHHKRTGIWAHTAADAIELVRDDSKRQPAAGFNVTQVRP